MGHPEYRDSHPAKRRRVGPPEFFLGGAEALADFRASTRTRASQSNLRSKRKGRQPCLARSLRCSVESAKTATTPPQRIRRPRQGGWNSASSAGSVASIPRTRNRSSGGSRANAPAARDRGVSSTAKLSVSKTELGGSNPSAPANISGQWLVASD